VETQNSHKKNKMEEIMKKLVLLFVLFASIFTLASCGKEDKVLQMLWWSDGTEGVVMQGLLDDYEEETGVVIELVPIAYNEYETKLATMISGGEAPALARVTEGHLNNFQDNILSLEGVYDDSGFTNLFFNSDGDVISLPMDITANGLFVNLDLLEAHGVDYPELGEDVWTWTEFETEMLKLKDQDGVVAPGIFDHQAHRFMPLIYQAGITIWDTPYTESNLTSQEAVDVVQMLMDFYAEGFLPRDAYVTKNSAQLFRTGQYGFHLSGNWNVSGYQDLTFDWTVVPMPQGANRATILGGKSLAAFDGSGMEEEAKAFIEWMAEGEQHDAYTGGVPYLTPRLGATVDYGDFADQYAVFLDEIAATDAEYVQDWLAEVMIPGMYPIINQFVEDAASGTAGTALELLTQLEIDLKAAAPTE
jgi:alpha-1,4-digalacturonate transport system substrate-binding protein